MASNPKSRPELRWYPRSPKRMLAMLRELTLEEVGFVGALEDLIFATGNHLDDDDRFIAGNVRIDPRRYKRLKAVAIAKAGFYVSEDANGRKSLRSRHCDEEVEAALARVESARDAGIQSGVARRYKSKAQSNKTKDLTGTAVRTGVRTPVGADARTINRSLHYSPSGNSGETVLSAEETRDFIAQVRQKAGRPIKDFVFKGATLEPPNIIVFDCLQKMEIADADFGAVIRTLADMKTQIDQQVAEYKKRCPSC